MEFWKHNPEVENLLPGDIIAAVVCSGLGFIAGIIWVIQRKPKGIKMVCLSAVMVVPQMIFWYFVNMIIIAMQHPRAGGF
jgi:thiamine transporter ThiT